MQIYFFLTVEPLQCHRCERGKSHEECDAHPPETCPRNKQVNITATILYMIYTCIYINVFIY